MNGPSSYPKFKKAIQILTLGLVIALVIAPQAVLASVITPQAIIELTNVERLKVGQKPLTANLDLTIAANAKAQNMFDNDYFDHFGPNGQSPWRYILTNGYDYQFAGENLAMNFDQVENVVRAWMMSETHRDNIIDPNFEEIGVAVANGALEGHETTLVVQMFGARQPTILKSLTPKVDLVDYVAELLGI